MRRVSSTSMWRRERRGGQAWDGAGAGAPDRQAVFAHMDTHAELLNIEQMRDMTRWNNEAARKNDPDWHP